MEDPLKKWSKKLDQAKVEKAARFAISFSSRNMSRKQFTAIVEKPLGSHDSLAKSIQL